MLLGHTDVVPADPAAWSAPPFAGVVRDGHLWGRGALDMKAHVACNAAALAVLAARGDPPAGDVVLVAEADEEDGGAGVGLPVLLAERPELRTDFALNEGGGRRLVLDGGPPRYLLATGEKAQLTVRVTVRARGGHASQPAAEANALTGLAEVLRALVAHAPAPAATAALAPLLDAVAPGDGALAARLAAARAAHPVLDGLVGALAGTTIAPTVVHGSPRINVVPGEASVLCDCRALPGATVEAILGEVRRALAGLEAEVAAEGPLWGGTSSPAATPLFEACRSALAALEPGAEPVATVFPGFTDSHFLRAAFGTVAYGFLPLRHTDPELVDRTVHAADERIHVADVDAGTRFLVDVVDALGATAPPR